MRRKSSAVVGLLAVCLPLYSSDLALVGGRIYPAPEAEPIPNGVVWIRDGRIAAVGDRRKIHLPAGVKLVDCAGLTVTAGFWNSHVHFYGPQWDHAAALSSSELAGRLEEMLTRYGFTTVFDTASFLGNTAVIQRRVESGEAPGPRIFTTGMGFAKPDGTPFYVKPLRLPEIHTPEQATEMARRTLRDGADAVKIFSGSAGVEGAMPLDLIRAVTAEAHRQGKWVFSHLVQEVKRVCYEAGKKPAARCDPTNAASRRTLEKAGFLPCGRLLVGEVQSLEM